jgi:hypothetical protein
MISTARRQRGPLPAMGGKSMRPSFKSTAEANWQPSSTPRRSTPSTRFPLLPRESSNAGGSGSSFQKGNHEGSRF